MRLGEFELLGVIGIGGFAVVYLAHDHSLGRRVALKEYMPSALAVRRGQTQIAAKSERLAETFQVGLKSFVNEAQLLAQFDHPSLVKVHRFWEANGTAYMVMQLCEGITLKDRLRQMGAPPDEAWLCTLLGTLTQALDVIHAAQCYHRDIAPDNIILLKGSERPVLLDFGAARRVIGDMTQALTVILKPGYAPLEQYAEVPHLKQGPWTDVYALAAVVFCAITGRPPPVSVGRILHDDLIPLERSAAGRYRPEFLAAVDRALAVRPDDRTPSITQFRAELGLGSEVEARDARNGAPGGVRVRPASKRSRPLLLGIGLTLLALGGAGAFLWFGSEPTTTATADKPAPTVLPAATTPPPLPAPVVTASANLEPAPASAYPPTAQPPAPAAIATSTADFTVGGEFERALRAQSGGFVVVAAPSKPVLRVGRDKLSFTVHSSRDGWVSVFVLGPDGSLTRLIPGNQAPIRIAAGQAVVLPPPSDPLEASEPAGHQEFLVLVSNQPRRLNIAGAHKEDGVLVLPTGKSLAEQAARTTPQQGSLLVGTPAADCRATDCWDYGAARFSIDIVR